MVPPPPSDVTKTKNWVEIIQDNWELTFTHVNSHTINYWNEVADRLAEFGAKGFFCTAPRFKDYSYSGIPALETALRLPKHR